MTENETTPEQRHDAGLEVAQLQAKARAARDFLDFLRHEGYVIYGWQQSGYSAETAMLPADTAEVLSRYLDNRFHWQNHERITRVRDDAEAQVFDIVTEAAIEDLKTRQSDDRMSF